MNFQDLQRVGNADLWVMTGSRNNNHERELQPAVEQPDATRLNVHSKMDSNLNLDYLSPSRVANQPHDKCAQQVLSKWQKFQARSFCKLNNQQKDHTFLQLYEDFYKIKTTLNEEMHKNKRLMTRLHMSEKSNSKEIKDIPLVSRNKFFKQKQEEVDALKKQIKKLHEKIVALSGTKHKFPAARPSTASKGQKNIVPVNQNIRAQLQSQRKHVRELLLIIDELKKNKFQVQQQLKNIQSNQSNIRVGRNQSKVAPNTDSQFHTYANQLQMWKQKYSDLELIFNKMSEDKDRKIKELFTELTTIKENQRMKENLNRRGTGLDVSEISRYEDRIKEIAGEKQRIETELRRLVQMPFYQNNKDMLDTHQKLSALEVKYQNSKSEMTKLAQLNAKYYADLEFKTKESSLLKAENEKMKGQLKIMFEKQHAKTKIVDGTAQIDYDDYFRQKLALVKLQGNDPIWKQYQGMAKPEIKSLTEDKAKALAQRLWLNKIELLAHLEKTQIELRTLREGMDSRFNILAREKQFLEEQLTLTRARLDEWKSMEQINNQQRRAFRVYEQAGVKYDDTVSVFDIEEREMKDLDSNQNYFDLYLGQLNIDEAELMRNPQNKVKNISHFISFVTVDFYNHETQHSNFAEGAMKKLGNNYSFKVEVNSYFLKYLSRNSMSIELWSPQGTATVLLGKGEIYLSDIVNNAAKDISSVVRGKTQIYNSKKLVATLDYRIRMRLPISSFIEWAESKNEFKLSEVRNPYSAARKKTLEIQVERATGLASNINSFVFFNVQGEDFCTEPERGMNPEWKFRQKVEVTLDEGFIDEIKHKYFEFTIFDDQKDMNEDVYGIARANFTPLLEISDALDLNLDIEDQHGGKKGKLKVKAKWLSD